MNIEKITNDKELMIKVEGRLDTVTAPELEKEVKDSVQGVEVLVFDLAGLDYISSAGLRVVLSAQKIMNAQGKMIVKNVNEAVMEIFEITGFTDVLTIE
jgi:anti-sigma B factor antagonist